MVKFLDVFIKSCIIRFINTNMSILVKHEHEFLFCHFAIGIMANNFFLFHTFYYGLLCLILILNSFF